MPPTLLLPLLLVLVAAATAHVRSSLRNSDPLNDVSAITAIEASVLHNLPVGQPPELQYDVLGTPLTPHEFSMEPPAKDFVPTDVQNDPLEIAGAFEGDIILSSQAELHEMTKPSQDFISHPGHRSAVKETHKVWPNGEVPYVISAAYTNEERGVIAVAMRNFHLETCINFVPRSTQKDYIHIYRGDGCSSSVGRVGGHQAVSLAQGCIYVGIVMHELMHAVGFWHEQSRYDRDSFIRINWANIKSGMEYNFQKYDWNTIAHLDINYDLGSIMHYGAKSFANNPSEQTITAINGEEIGQRRGFSKMDVQKLRKLYMCDSGPPSKVTTQTSVTGGGHGGSAYTQCKDVYVGVECGKWAASGECQKNPDWMLPNCQKSCEHCKEECRDGHEHCGYWAGTNECKTNAAYMHLYCKKSCGLCHTASDVSNDCVDKNEYCADWAASGMCHTHTDYMVNFCKKSCTECI